MHCCAMSLAWDLMDLRTEGSRVLIRKPCFLFKSTVNWKRRCFVFLSYFNRDVCDFFLLFPFFSVSLSSLCTSPSLSLSELVSFSNNDASVAARALGVDEATTR